MMGDNIFIIHFPQGHKKVIMFDNGFFTLVCFCASPVCISDLHRATLLSVIV